MLDSNLCEFLWRKNQGQEDLFEKILEAIARFRPIDWLMQLLY